MAVAMESGPRMLAPVCLVENNNEQLLVNQQAIQILEKISQPVVVVAIVGLYRTGKSYLMNHLAGQNHGKWYPGTQASCLIPAVSQLLDSLPQST